MHFCIYEAKNQALALDSRLSAGGPEGNLGGCRASCRPRGTSRLMPQICGGKPRPTDEEVISTAGVRNCPENPP